jgi:1,4-dihydroxy-2-naphthoate octaprenyltransferase
MIKALTTHHNRKLSVIFLAACCASAIVAGVIGIEDNAPGILCAFTAAIALILAFVHPWRTPKQYSFLLLGAILCFVIFGVLHNVFHEIAGNMEDAQMFRKLLEGLGVATFLLALLVCPPAVIVGLVGSIAMLVRNHRRPRHV